VARSNADRQAQGYVDIGDRAAAGTKLLALEDGQ
jgi:hypothetical protein